MPELPEVEVLVRHLAPLLRRRTIRGVAVHRERVIRPTSRRALGDALTGARIKEVTRRGKYLLFELVKAGRHRRLLGHLGMTGRMYLQPAAAPLPKHAAVSLELGRHRFVFEDTRYFGRFTLDLASCESLGPEPLADTFSAAHLHAQLRRSARPVKVRLLDQALVAGVGNIYASEALFVAGISPRRRSRALTRAEAGRLHEAVRHVLADAIALGSTIPLDFAGAGRKGGLFYYGQSGGAAGYYEERLRVYDRAGEPCSRCGAAIRRIVQAARSTFFCPGCQK